MRRHRRRARLSGAAALLAAGLARAAEPGPEFASRVERVVDGYTVRSTVGPSDTPLPPELADFLLDRPDLAAFIVRRRGIAPYRVEMLGPRRSSADDGDGTVGVIDLVVREPGRRLYYGEGEHRARLFPRVRAAAVIDMTLEPRVGPDCRPYTRTSFLVSVRMKSRFVSGVVKTLRPFLQETVIRKFSKAFLVADEVGRLMARDPAGVAEDVRAYGSLDEADRARLSELMAALTRPARCPERAGSPGEFQ